MTDKEQPDKFDWATELSDAEGHVTLSAKEAHEIGARLRSMGDKLKAYEDLDEAASDVQLLRTGYAAARLEIESLQARLKTMAEEHADELMVAHLDGMQAAQPAPQQEAQYNHGPQAETVAEAARDVGKWLNERPNRPIDLRHVAMLCAHAQAAQDAQEPVAWYVTGCGRLLDEDEAKAEARHIGGTARAIPLYTVPQADSQPAPDEILNMARERGLPETETEGVFRVNADDLCRVAAAILASRATADSVTAPAATVIKKGADRQWMSERLGHLPDGIYSLYLAPPTQAQAVNQADRPFIVRLAEDFAEECVTAGYVTTKAASYGRLMDEVLSSQAQAVAGVKAVHQFRKKHCADWYDGFADHSDGGGPYEERILYTVGAVPLLTGREIELIDGMIQVQLDHASRCDAIANRSMADKQKGWDMERVALLQKFKAHGIKGGQHGTE